VAELAKKGVIKGIVDSVFKFNDVLAAYDRLLSRSVVGRVVVQVAEDLE
jgi:NADPH:quinone reductase-like Zn-dependent oxidoreductase